MVWSKKEKAVFLTCWSFSSFVLSQLVRGHFLKYHRNSEMFCQRMYLFVRSKALCVMCMFNLNPNVTWYWMNPKHSIFSYMPYVIALFFRYIVAFSCCKVRRTQTERRDDNVFIAQIASPQWGRNPGANWNSPPFVQSQSSIFLLSRCSPSSSDSNPEMFMTWSHLVHVEWQNKALATHDVFLLI